MAHVRCLPFVLPNPAVPWPACRQGGLLDERPEQRVAAVDDALALVPPDAREAAAFAITKGRQIIDEQGDRLFDRK